MIGLSPEEFLSSIAHLPELPTPPAEPTGFVPTLNKTGYMTSTLDPFSSQFVERVGNFSKPILEVGSAYGVAALPALKNGATVIANDLDPRHLRILISKVPASDLARLRILDGSFPEELMGEIPPGSLDGCLVARVFHFFSGEKIIAAVRTIYEWLAPGGELTVVGETPYLSNWQSFIPVFEARRQKGELWPGWVEDPKQFAPERAKFLPAEMHLLDLEVLRRIFSQIGFEIQEAAYLNRTDFPPDMRLDGRESVGIRGIKPA